MRGTTYHKVLELLEFTKEYTYESLKKYFWKIWLQKEEFRMKCESVCVLKIYSVF